MSSTTIQNQDEFKNELVKRFFNPQSYFFLCLSTQLQDISAVACDIDEDDYLIIGQIMQHFVESENPRQELSRFAVIERYRDFNHGLDEVIGQLRQPGLNAEDMKKLIESAANDFVEVLVDVIHDDASRTLLLQLAGIDLPSRDRQQETGAQHNTDVPPLELDPSLTELNETILEETRNLEESILPEEEPAERASGEDMLDALPEFYETAGEGHTDLSTDMQALTDDLLDPTMENALYGNDAQEPLVNIPGFAAEEDGDAKEEARDQPEPEPEQAPAPPDDSLQPPADLEELTPVDAPQPDFTPMQQDTVDTPRQPEPEAHHETVAPQEEEGPASRLAENPAAEPLNLSRGFCDQAEKIIAGIRDEIDALAAGKTNQKSWKKLKNQFLDLRESAMIHGFQLTEELAGKVQKLAERLAQPPQPLPEPVHELLVGLPDLLAASLAEEYSDTLGDTAKNVIRQVVQATLAPQDFTGPAEREPSLAQRKVREEILPPDNGQIDAAAPLMPPAEPIPDTPPAPVPEDPSELPAELAQEDEQVSDDDLSLPLPGENDPELLALIQEVSQHAAVPAKRAGEKKQEPAAFSPPTQSGEEDDAVLTWRSESELYFRVINESLDKLADNPTDRLALENLELASYSMKGLARKLDIDHYALFPELVEELVSKVLLLHLPCPVNPAEVIRKGFTLLREGADINDETPELRLLEKEMRRFIQSLDDFMPRDEQVEQQQPARPARAGEEEVVVQRKGSFKLKGRDTAEKPPQKQPGPEPAGKLDYLMNKDLGSNDEFE